MNNPTNSTTRSTDCVPEEQPGDTNLSYLSYGTPVCPYDRKQALADGLQREVSSEYMKHERRIWDFLVPKRLFLTKKVIEACGIPDHYEERGGLWQILSALEAIFDGADSNRVPFDINAGGTRRWVHAVWCAVDIDDPTPSITIVMPDED